MKKTVLIFSMALGSLVAFAQTPKSMTMQAVQSIEQHKVPAYKMTANQQPERFYTTNDYKGSIFTKNGENLFPNVITFSAASDLTIGTNPAHVVGTGKGKFIWMNDTTQAAFSAAKDGTSTLLATYNYITGSGTSPNILSSESKGDGYIIISPINAFLTETENVVFDSWAELTAVANTSAVAGVYLQFYQRVRRFNEDRFFVEYNSTGDRWDSVEINIRGIDLATNQGENGVLKVALPTSAAGHSDLRVRFRLTGVDDQQNDQPAGIYWIIDDVAMYAAPEDAVQYRSETYYRGFYHYIPTNLRPEPIMWYCNFENTGSNAAKKVKGMINKLDTVSNTTITLAESHAFHFVDPSKGIDRDTTPISVIDSLSIGESKTAAQVANLPTDVSGEYKIYSYIQSEAGVTDTSIRYQVFVNSNPYYSSFAYHNNYIATNARWATSLNTTTNYFSTDDTVTVCSPGYQFSLAYQTDSNSATVDGSDLYINGVRLMSSIYSRPGAVIAAFITKDSAVSSTQFRLITIGYYDYYEVKSEDISTTGSFKYITLPFRERTISENEDTITDVFKGVKLEKGTTYRVWYQFVDVITHDDGAFYLAVDIAPSYAPRFGVPFGQVMLTVETGNEYLPSPANTPYIEMLVGAQMLDSIHREVGIKNQLSPATFNLSNYPNPAKEQTTISYTLVKSGNVAIEVRDVMGRIVKSIERGNQAAQDYNYVLNTADLRNGTYFYSLKVNGISQTKKMLINK